MSRHYAAPGPWRRGAIVLLAVLLPGSACLAAEPLPPLEELLSPWYYTEVVIFQRPTVLDHLAGESLTGPPAPLARDLRVLHGAGTPPAADYALYPAMHAFLTFPFLDQERLPDFASPQNDTEPVADAGAAAGRSPPAIRPRLAPDPELDFLERLARFEDALRDDSYRWLPADTFTLAPEAGDLARRAGFQVLVHGRWLQPVPERNAPEPVLIRTGAAADALHALQGTVDVTLGRYLHVRANLYYVEPLLGRAPLEFARAPAGSAGQEPRAALTPDLLTPAGYMQLRQSRRVRSGELHYLDHPKLGVLVRIEPVQAPPALADAYRALRSSLEEGQQ